MLSVLGAMALLCAGLAGAVLRALPIRRPDPADEAFIASLRASHAQELPDWGHERLNGSQLASEADALAWGFPQDWMAAERVQLFWASRKDRA